MLTRTTFPCASSLFFWMFRLGAALWWYNQGFWAPECDCSCNASSFTNWSSPQLFTPQWCSSTAVPGTSGRYHQAGQLTRRNKHRAISGQRPAKWPSWREALRAQCWVVFWEWPSPVWSAFSGEASFDLYPRNSRPHLWKCASPQQWVWSWFTSSVREIRSCLRRDASTTKRHAALAWDRCECYCFGFAMLSSWDSFQAWL